jgi:hypothetical protein
MYLPSLSHSLELIGGVNYVFFGGDVGDADAGSDVSGGM